MEKTAPAATTPSANCFFIQINLFVERLPWTALFGQVPVTIATIFWDAPEFLYFGEARA